MNATFATVEVFQDTCASAQNLVTTRHARYEGTAKAAVRRARYKAKLKTARQAARIERNRARSIDTFGFYSGPVSNSVGFPRKEKR